MDKWTPSTWFSSTQAEFYEGAEYITSPAADALIQQAFAAHAPPAGFTAPKILDAGSGLGQLTAELQNSKWKGSQVVCLDKDASLVEAVETKIKKHGWENVEVVSGSVESLTYKDNEFSNVFGNFLYMLLPNPLVGLKESFRVLAPGGTLALTTWKKSGPLAVLSKALSLIPDAPKPSTPPGVVLWTNPEYIRSQVELLPGASNAKIEPFTYTCRAKSAKDMSRDLRQVVHILVSRWPEELREKSGWDYYGKIEEVLNQEYRTGNGEEVAVTNEAWVITVQKA